MCEMSENSSSFYSYELIAFVFFSWLPWLIVRNMFGRYLPTEISVNSVFYCCNIPSDWQSFSPTINKKSEKKKQQVVISRLKGFNLHWHRMSFRSSLCYGIHRQMSQVLRKPCVFSATCSWGNMRAYSPAFNRMANWNHSFQSRRVSWNRKLCVRLLSLMHT